MYKGRVYWHKTYLDLPKYSGTWMDGEYVERNTVQDVLATISHEPEDDCPGCSANCGSWIYKEVDLNSGEVLILRVHKSFNEAYRYNL